MPKISVEQLEKIQAKHNKNRFKKIFNTTQAKSFSAVFRENEEKEDKKLNPNNKLHQQEGQTASNPNNKVHQDSLKLHQNQTQTTSNIKNTGKQVDQENIEVLNDRLNPNNKLHQLQPNTIKPQQKTTSNIGLIELKTIKTTSNNLTDVVLTNNRCTLETTSLNRSKLHQIPIQKESLPTSKQQLVILNFLFEKQKETGLNCTPRLKRRHINKETGIKERVIALQISRLEAKGFIKRLDIKHGRGTSGIVYFVPKEICEELENIKLHQNHEPNYINKPHHGNVSSGSLLTNNKKTMHFLDTLITKLGLDEYNLTANDILPILQSEVFENDIESLKQSLEHITFYLNSEQSEGIIKPKSFLISKLKKGYYGQPIGYETLEEIKLKQKIKDLEDKKKRIDELKERELELEFELWLTEISQDKKKEILTEYYPNTSIGGVAEKSLLLEHFKKEKGLLEN